MRTAWLVVAPLLLVWGHAGDVHAATSLGDDRRALLAHAKKNGAALLLQKSWFLQESDERNVRLRKTAKNCVTVIVLATHGQKTRLRLGSEPRGKGIDSNEGMLALTRCGRHVATLDDGLFIRMGSNRGAVDLFQFAHARGRYRWSQALPMRQGAGKTVSLAASQPFRVPPAKLRTQLAYKRAREDGAKQHLLLRTRADSRGRGGVGLTLEPGCHRLSVVGVAPKSAGLDIDAEVRSKDGTRLLAEDHGQAPDAVLSFCHATTRTPVLRFLGAQPTASVYVVRATWALPFQPLPAAGAETQARLAWALFRQGISTRAASAYGAYVGAAGQTYIPIRVQSGRCYYAAAAAMHGQTAALRLSARVNDQRYLDAATGGNAATVMSFCARREGVAALRLRQVGRTSSWFLQLWQTPELRK